MAKNATHLPGVDVAAREEKQVSTFGIEKKACENSTYAQSHRIQQLWR